MNAKKMLAVLLAVCSVMTMASCQRPSAAPEPLVLRYTGVDEDTEQALNARLAAVVDASGKAVFRFSEADETGGAKGKSKLCRVEGAEVEFRPVPFPVYKGADDIFALALSTQTKYSTPAVHLFFVDLYWFQTFSASWLMPFEGSDWAPSNFKHDFIEACCLPSPEGARGAATQKKVYAIPFSAKGNMLFYRKDVLDLFGLSPPETWDALRYAVQTVREGVGASDFAARLEALLLKSFPELKANPTRMAEQMQAWKARLQRLRYGLLLHSRSFHNDFYPIVWGYGGDIFTGDQTKQRLASQALRDIKAMMYEEAASPIRLAPSQAVFEGPFAEASFQLNHAFADGDALFMVDWEDRLDKMLRYVQAERGVHGDTAVRVDSVGVCPIPHMPDQKSACNIGSWGWVVNSQTVSSGDPVRDAIAKKAVEQFLYHLTSEDAQEWLAEHFGYVPSREIRLSEPVLAKLESTNPTVMTLFRFFRTKGKVRFINRPGSKRLNDVLEQALHRALAETPQKDPAAEWEFLSKILAEVRQQAGYL